MKSTVRTLRFRREGTQGGKTTITLMVEQSVGSRFRDSGNYGVEGG